MSHFLQRLALSVAGPRAGPQLRPLRGSIYAPAGFAATAERALPVEPAAESLAPEARGASAQAGVGDRAVGFELPQEPTVSAEAMASPERIPSRVPADSTERFARAEFLLQPELLLAAERSEARRASAPDAAARRDLARSGGEKKLTPMAGEEGHAGREEMFRGGERRLARAAQNAAASVAPLRAPQAVEQQAARPARFAGSEPARRAADIAREPDEITIHIGRIEVAAISQSAARPAPAAPARKSIHLDEYLRRGNGRAR